MRSLHRFIPLLDMALLGQRTSDYDTAVEVLARPQTLTLVNAVIVRFLKLVPKESFFG